VPQAPAAAAADASASTSAGVADIKAELMQALEGIDRGIFGVQVGRCGGLRCAAGCPAAGCWPGEGARAARGRRPLERAGARWRSG
jgi:hypothetical protein